MPDPVVHITLDYTHTLCRRVVGELDGGDTYTSDVIVATAAANRPCPECLEKVDQPLTYWDMVNAVDRAYQQGWAQGKDRAYMEMEYWPAQEHNPTCGCITCKTVRNAINKLLGGADDGTARAG